MSQHVCTIFIPRGRKTGGNECRVVHAAQVELGKLIINLALRIPETSGIYLDARSVRNTFDESGTVLKITRIII